MATQLAETRDASGTERRLPFLIQLLTSPALLGGSLLALFVGVRLGVDPSKIAGAAVGFTALSLLMLETLYPMRKEWQMTARSFFHRDVKYFALTGTTLALTTWALARLGIELGGRGTEVATNLPLPAAVVVGILTVEFLQYWQHRFSHKARCKVGRFLWRTHAPHHLPDGVYVLMHVASHPLNWFLVRLITIVTLWTLGIQPEAVAFIVMITGVQGVIGHTNIDLRAGWLNYALVGTELHRSHHGAGPEDGLNYGVTTPFWDILFGTFRYSPGVAPQRLGVRDPDTYPSSYRVRDILLLPFKQA
jgi:sterol desaturase/sphingolipid hydroxylase (fatty acid hydroxylase superfamily)